VANTCGFDGGHGFQSTEKRPLLVFWRAGILGTAASAEWMTARGHAFSHG